MKDFLYKWLCFWTENFIANLETSIEKFDLILCLGTVKWIHLNHGDIGVKALFLKSFESLEKGGIFVIEAQNWKSYKKKKNLTKELSENYRNIQLRPKNFDEYLTK